MDDAAGEDRLAEPVRGLLDGGALGADAFEDLAAFFQVVRGW
jgi:hypothetical protein